MKDITQGGHETGNGQGKKSLKIVVGENLLE
jgi:hypothetical protein